MSAPLEPHIRLCCLQVIDCTREFMSRETSENRMDIIVLWLFTTSGKL